MRDTDSGTFVLIFLVNLKQTVSSDLKNISHDSSARALINTSNL